MFTFIELPSFEQIREQYLNDEEFRALQHFLLQNPKAGEVIPVPVGAVSCAGRRKGVVNAAGCVLSISCARHRTTSSW
jgi:hypothetical protein